MQLQHNKQLKDLTTFRIGGTATWYAAVGTREELVAAAREALARRLPVYILGGGSNLLISDDTIEGLVIHIRMRGISYAAEQDTTFVTMAAGEVWDTVVEETVSRGLSGFENLSAIPGSAGAAVVQNIGAYGAELKDTLYEVEVFDLDTFEFKKLSAKECELGYRDSIFKHEAGKNFVVVNVTCKLAHVLQPNISYKDVAAYFSAHNISSPKVQHVRDAICEIRRAKLPDTKVLGTAGSFFKNPTVTAEHAAQLKNEYPEIVMFEAPQNSKKISAAWILDHLCGFRGYKEGNVGVYEKQSLVLVNFVGATKKEIDLLAEKMISCVFQKTKINLEREVVSW